MQINKGHVNLLPPCPCLPKQGVKEKGIINESSAFPESVLNLTKDFVFLHNLTQSLIEYLGVEATQRYVYCDFDFSEIYFLHKKEDCVKGIQH